MKTTKTNWLAPGSFCFCRFIKFDNMIFFKKMGSFKQSLSFTT